MRPWRGLAILAWAFCGAGIATAEVQLSNPTSGFRWYLAEDGGLRVVPGPEVQLQDGSVLQLREGRYRLVPTIAAVDGVQRMAPAALAIDWQTLENQRIMVGPVGVHSATVHGAIVELPGLSVDMDFANVSRDALIRILENCTGLLSSCRYDIVATVLRGRDGHLWLARVLLSPASVEQERSLRTR